MNEITQVLGAVVRGEAGAAQDLLPLMYELSRPVLRGGVTARLFP